MNNEQIKVHVRRQLEMVPFLFEPVLHANGTPRTLGFDDAVWRRVQHYINTPNKVGENDVC
jgi:hypothetical protein